MCRHFIFELRKLKFPHCRLSFHITRPARNGAIYGAVYVAARPVPFDDDMMIFV
jgi:hypothetical protein